MIWTLDDPKAFLFCLILKHKYFMTYCSTQKKGNEW